MKCLVHTWSRVHVLETPSDCFEFDSMCAKSKTFKFVYLYFQGRIKLDVGGNIFTTSILTLTRESDSMLAAMFSGRHDIISEPDGCVFIDRDGTHFRYVLNYLRDGGVQMDSLPRNRQLLKELRKEAVYYQLHGLIQQIEKHLY